MPGSYEGVLSPAVSSGDTLSVAQANQVRDKVNHLNRNFNQRRSLDETSDVPIAKYLALKLTSAVTNAVGFFKVKRFAPPTFPDPGGDIAETDLGKAGTDDEAYLVDLSALGQYRLGHITSYTQDGLPVYVVPTLANSLEVDVTQVGGSAGSDQVSACTYTYDVYLAGTTIKIAAAASLTGKGNGWRSLKVQLTAAAYGRGCFVNGAFQLRDCDECPANEKDCA